MDDGNNSGNDAQIAYWNDHAARTWTAFQERIDAVFAPLTAVALDAAAARPGERVLDIGCGCGTTALELAQRVGPTGHVNGFDVSVPMAARARERIATAGLQQAEIVVADAAECAFPPAGADLLFSRFGVMFFADPGAAFANLRRGMRPGGRLLCAAWRKLAENPWFSTPLEAAGALLPPAEALEPNAPGPFAFADGARVKALLAGAGWQDVGTCAVDVGMRLAPAGQIAEATEFATRVGPLARAMAEVGPDVQSSVRAAVADRLRSHDGPDGVTLPGAIWLISARC